MFVLEIDADFFATLTCGTTMTCQCMYMYNVYTLHNYYTVLFLILHIQQIIKIYTGEN